MKKNNSLLGVNLCIARKSRGISQKDIAELVGMSQPAYQALETGRNKKTSFLPQIAKVLEVEVEWLLYNTESDISAPLKNDLTTGDRVRIERLKLNMSQVDLAEKAGVTQGAISGLENGRNETSKELPAIATALGKSVEFLLCGNDLPCKTKDNECNSHSRKPLERKMKALVISQKIILIEPNFLEALRCSKIPDGVEQISDTVFSFDLEKSSENFANLLSFLNNKGASYRVMYLENNYVEFNKS